MAPRILVQLSLTMMMICTVAVAQDASTSGLDGRYRLAMSSERAESVIHAAIEKATEEMGPLREHIGHNRLEDKNPVLQSIEIRLSTQSARIRYGEFTFDIPRGGFGSVRTPDEESARARARTEGNRLVVDWRLDGAQRRDVFVRDGDSLTLSVHIRAEALPDDVRYRLRFRTDR